MESFNVILLVVYHIKAAPSVVWCFRHSEILLEGRQFEIKNNNNNKNNSSMVTVHYVRCSEFVSQLIGILSPVNHYGLYQGCGGGGGV